MSIRYCGHDAPVGRACGICCPHAFIYTKTEFDAAVQSVTAERDQIRATANGLADQLQSATERMSCGHWKGDWVDTVTWTEPPVKVNELVARIPYCRTCAEIEAAFQSGLSVTRGDIAQLKQEHQAEILERTAAAMVMQREAACKLECAYCSDGYPLRVGRFKEQFDCLIHDFRGTIQLCLARRFREMPFASAESQKWLEEHDHEVTMKEHANHTQFAADLYSIMVDPCAEGSIKEEDMFAALFKAAKDNRQALHDALKPLTRQLAVARADAYRQCSIEMCPNCRKEIPAEKNSHGFWYHDSEPCEAGELLDLVAEAEAQAREGEVKT